MNFSASTKITLQFWREKAQEVKSKRYFRNACILQVCPDVVHLVEIAHQNEHFEKCAFSTR